MNLYNTLSRQVEEFAPLQDKKVGMYTCGPTVYFYPQIGNWRTFVFEDILRRALEYNGMEVKQVMNITDVGHLTGDNIGDADVGEDRMEKAAARENKTAWDIANFYMADFIKSREKLNILTPAVLPRATDHIQEQIELVAKLLKKGLAYQTDKAIYFEVSKFPEYGKLGGQKLVDKRVATREELVEDKGKHHPFDFALWKFSLPNERRQMEWESPWGVGFPGWHIECSAMSMKYLGQTFDIHTGGADHVAIHHANEIAQSEGATGKLFARYWLHGAFLTVDGGRMGKSLGNAYTLQELEAAGYEPLALRYFYLTGHYRKQLNFTWKALQAAQTALNGLRDIVYRSKTENERIILSKEKLDKVDDYRERFETSINDDLNIPAALAVVWEVAKSSIPGRDKADLLNDFDQVLGLRLIDWEPEKIEISDDIKALVQQREIARHNKDYQAADKLRAQIEHAGYELIDTPKGVICQKKKD